MMIRQFIFIQENYPSKNPQPRRIFHEVFSLEFEEQNIMMGALDLLKDFAMDCCSYYFFEMGFQVVYAIHSADSQKHLHIHFAINTTSFVTGKRRHEKLGIIKERQGVFYRWFQAYLGRVMAREYQNKSVRARIRKKSYLSVMDDGDKICRL